MYTWKSRIYPNLVPRENFQKFSPTSSYTLILCCRPIYKFLILGRSKILSVEKMVMEKLDGFSLLKPAFKVIFGNFEYENSSEIWLKKSHLKLVGSHQPRVRNLLQKISISYEIMKYQNFKFWAMRKKLFISIGN